MEEWRIIKDFEDYQVSNLGRVMSLKRGKRKILSPRVSKNYKNVTLSKNGTIKTKLVHRLVAEAFIPNENNKPVVDHIDTNTLNNCVDNLRWVTVKENCLNNLTREHNSKSKKGHKCYLKNHTDETKKKISQTHKGRKLTEEHKKKLSEAHKGKGKPNSLKGKHWKIERGKRIWY